MGSPSVLAAQNLELGRPTVGLVLGGGGAKGGAHIGVLKVLEELRIPIDYIAGTSIGAVIGGLYASGMTVVEIEHLLASIDWQSLVSNTPPRRYQPFRLKLEGADIPSQLELGFNDGGFQFPSGILSAQNVELALKAATLPVAQVQDFRDLPIPFRAVAADLKTGEVVVLGEGDLSSAIRASASLPGIFAPVERGGRLLIDGGIVMNLPVEVAKAMGADVIIAVDLTAPPMEAEELTNALAISSQVFRLNTLQNAIPQREMLQSGRDVLLLPDVEDVALADFRSLLEATVAGEAVARAHTEDLRRLAVSAEEYSRVTGERGRGAQMEVPVDFVRVEGATRLDPDILRGRLDLRLGRPLAVEELNDALNRLFATGFYERVDYKLVHAEPGTGDEGEGVEVRVTEKRWGPGFLRLGVAIGNDLERGRSGFSLLASHSQTQINRLGAELATSLRIGEAQAARVEFFQPIDRGGHLFIAPRLEYQEASLELAVTGAGEIDRGVREFTAAVALGMQFTDWGELRVELLKGSANARSRDSGIANADVGAVLARFSLDLLDDAAFPTSGTRVRIEAFRSASTLGANPSYTRLEATGLAAFSRRSTTLLLEARAGTSAGTTLPVHHDFALGGFQRLSGVRPREFLGDKYGFGRFGVRRKVGTLPTAPQGGDFFVGASGEFGHVWTEAEGVSLGDVDFSASVFLGAETLLGPIYLGYGLAETGDDTLYLFLGRAF